MADSSDNWSTAARITTGHFDRFHVAILRYLCQFCPEQAEAEDLMQETFLRLFLEIRNHHEPPNVKAWLFRTGHNLAVDRSRRLGGPKRLVPIADFDGDIRDPGSSAEQQIIERERVQRVRQAMAWLSPQQRQCLELRAEGLRYREISQILGIQISSVKTFIVRAVARIAGRSDA